MPKRKSAARASIQNLREANKKRQKKETETGDAPDLDPDLREWCEHQDISMGQVVDEDGNDTNTVQHLSKEGTRCYIRGPKHRNIAKDLQRKFTINKISPEEDS
ncbi:hypothetical protein BC827DRAFT_1152524 [Russula dissimulans]|nr:hypothetical protein BC827DRAFT_1152524 [Russula dissimulans]